MDLRHQRRPDPGRAVQAVSLGARSDGSQRATLRPKGPYLQQGYAVFLIWPLMIVSAVGLAKATWDDPLASMRVLTTFAVFGAVVWVLGAALPSLLLLLRAVLGFVAGH
jgi:hypothetical protein